MHRPITEEDVPEVSVQSELPSKSRNKYALLLNDSDLAQLFRTHKAVSTRQTRNVVMNSYTWAYFSYIEDEDNEEQEDVEIVDKDFDLQYNDSHNIEEHKNEDNRNEQFSFAYQNKFEENSNSRKLQNFLSGNQRILSNQNPAAQNTSLMQFGDDPCSNIVFNQQYQNIKNTEEEYNEEDVQQTPELLTYASDQSEDIFDEAAYGNKASLVRLSVIKEQFKYRDDNNPLIKQSQSISDSKNRSTKAQSTPEVFDAYSMKQSLSMSPNKKVLQTSSRSEQLQSQHDDHVTTELLEELRNESQLQGIVSLDQFAMEDKLSKDDEQGNKYYSDKAKLAWSSMSSLREIQSNKMHNSGNSNNMERSLEQLKEAGFQQIAYYQDEHQNHYHQRVSLYSIESKVEEVDDELSQFNDDELQHQ